MAKTILIVDDSSSLRTVVRIALTRAGYDVLEAADGVLALKAMDGPTRVNLVVCDVNMPNMDGITFVKHVKQHPRHKFTPVVMLTTEGEEDARRRDSLAQAKTWITKPIHPPQLLDTVSRLLLG